MPAGAGAGAGFGVGRAAQGRTARGFGAGLASRLPGGPRGSWGFSEAFATARVTAADRSPDMAAARAPCPRPACSGGASSRWTAASFTAGPFRLERDFPPALAASLAARIASSSSPSTAKRFTASSRTRIGCTASRISPFSGRTFGSADQ